MLCANCGHAVARAHEVPTTPVPELVESNLNIIPSASQRRAVLDTMSDAQSHITQIDNDLAGLMESAHALQSKRAALVHYTNIHAALVAPIRRLPPEMLSEIFLHCKEKHFYPCKSLRVDRGPLLVSQVCGRWRCIALSSTPRLWATLMLTIQPKYLESDVLLAKTWLGRSGTYPLSIALGSRGNYSRSMKSLTEVFVAHCERWRDLQLSLPTPVIHSLSAVRNRLPKLQRLYLGHEWDEDVNIFEFAPQLRRVYLPTNSPSFDTILPWNQLEYCNMGTHDAASCLELLRSTPNLEACTLSPFDPDLAYEPQPPVQLPRLRSMEMHGNSFAFLNELLAPQLHKVTINVSGHSWVGTPYFISLFSQSSLQILTLDSFVNHPPDTDMITLLQASPMLLELNIRFATSRCLTKTFLRHFVGHQVPGQHLVPALQILRVDYSTLNFNIADFVAAISRRMPCDINKVEIRLVSKKSAVPSIDVATTTRLQQLRDTGLDIVCIRY